MKCGLVPLQVTNRAHADWKSILATRIQKKAACKFWAPAATEALLASRVSDALGHPHHT